MKVISLKDNKKINSIQYPLDLIDTSLFFVSKSTTTYPLADMTIYEKKSKRSKEIHSINSVIDFPYEYPFVSYATHSSSGNVAFYTFFRFNLISKELHEVGTIHLPQESEFEGIFMTDSEVMYSVFNKDADESDDETSLYLFDAKKQRVYTIEDRYLRSAISTPTIFQRKGEAHLLLNPYLVDTWESEESYRNQEDVPDISAHFEYIGVISLKQFVKECKANIPFSITMIDSKEIDGFTRVIAENIDSFFYIRKDYATQIVELVQVNKETFNKSIYQLPNGFSYNTIRIFNDHVYFVSTTEDYFYAPIKKEIFRIEHTYFQHLDDLLSVYVHYIDERYIVADCWTRKDAKDLFHVAIVDKLTKEVQYFNGKSMACEVFDQTVIIY
ncbi:hypothetical protein [Bacillus suaedaesalsae]|uniref:Uncharacterized protein n=1 Tax=Bacillus suaedaesalsae TaxID=2810349 RepID=A0ABS2DIL5_9BACI|nr:hypothetical protein [Bacillus suaedaesalsae]MBM6618308.1 hypothetical protein [Bacillus suaedaesalsae]